METIFISDDKVQLVLVPVSELDRLLLNKLSEGGPIEMEIIRQPVGVLGRSVKDAIIVRSKAVPNANKAKELQRV